MSSIDGDYCIARAEEERALAASTKERTAANIHLELATKYEALAERVGAHPVLRPGRG